MHLNSGICDGHICIPSLFQMFTLRFGGCTCRMRGKSPNCGLWDQIVVVSEGQNDKERNFSVSLHSHTIRGDGAPGGWGHFRGLGPPASPGTCGGPPYGRLGHHVCKLYLRLPLLI